MNPGRRLARRARLVLTSLTTAVLVAACGGGTSQYEVFAPDQYVAFGDETSAILADGRRYTVNPVSSVGGIDCTAEPIWSQALAAHYGFTFQECNPVNVTEFKAHETLLSTQIRETRRVRGRYWLTREDVLGARQFDDQIALCGAPIEDHNGTADTKWLYIPDSQCVGVPLRTLIPAQAVNVFVAGRCFSASHDAHASVRSMGQTMALGQAAGTAAALAARRSAQIDDVSATDVRDQLRRDGAILE